MIQAKIIADSLNPHGNRLTTFVVTFPRIILAELNTHRMLSKNSASSRAIPFEKMVKAVEENPFIPIAWQKDHKGMQGTEYLNTSTSCKVWNNQLTDDEDLTIVDAWLDARDKAVEVAKNLSKSEVTKQLCNRLLEPFMWHTVIISGTDFENFFALRCPKYKSEKGFITRSRKDWVKESGINETTPTTEVEWLKLNEGQAEIHMMALAEAMWDAYNESVPKQLQPREWHIPFGDKIDNKAIIELITKNLISQGLGLKWESEDYKKKEDIKVKIATARCARVSYTVVGEEGKPDNYENDIKLHDRLATSGHWSCFEHCAQAMSEDQVEQFKTYQPRGWSEGKSKAFFTEEKESGVCGNFKGFIQYRKFFENENITIKGN
jgi:hypothetical protein